MTITEQIKTAMARAFFACAWADMQEEKDADDPSAVNLSGREIMDVMPDEIDSAAIHAANTLAMDMERANGMQSIEELFALAVSLRGPNADRAPTPENFGHYCAMQAMGHGVGLWDSFDIETHDGGICRHGEELKTGARRADSIAVPYVEFGSHSLSKDY